MEPSKIFGVSEECHSNESGWTMYIGSLIQADSDDSLASDASSGPVHRGGHGTLRFQHDEDEEEGDCYLDKKAKKSVKKPKLGMIKKERKDEKEQMTFMAKAASTPARSGSKVRKSIWLGKRK